MLELNISAMACGHCVGAVTKLFKHAGPKAKVEIDRVTHKVWIESGKHCAERDRPLRRLVPSQMR